MGYYLRTPRSFAANVGWDLLGGRVRRSLRQSQGVDPGVETRAAYEAARGAGATVVLGDRPIQVTVRRLLNALSLPDKLKLLLLPAALLWAQVARGGIPKVEEADLDVDRVLAELGRLPTGLAGPLLHERDVYLAWSMRRSKAVNGAEVVVGVVGRAHMRGVCYALLNEFATDGLQFRDLNGAEGREFRSSLMSFLATEQGAQFRLGYKPGKSRPGTDK